MVKVDLTSALWCLQAWQDPSLWAQTLRTPGYERVLRHAGFSAEDLLQGLLWVVNGRALHNLRESNHRGATLASKRIVGRLKRDHQAISGVLKHLENTQGKIITAALERARTFLPPGAEVHTTVYVVIGGWADACLIDGAVVIDLLDFVGRSALMVKVLGHEFHHLGYYSLHNAAPDTTLAGFRNNAVAEGIAMHTMAPLTFKDSYYYVLWMRHWGKTARYLRDFEGLSEEAVRTQEASLRKKWFQNVGAAYYLCQKMAENIERRRCRQSLLTIISEGPEVFLHAGRECLLSR